MAAAPDAIYVRKLLQKSTDEDGDKKHYIYLHTKVYDDRMEFLMLETRRNATFKAEVTNEKIKSISDTLRIPYDEFYKSCLDAVTAQNIGMPGFTYEIDRNDNMLKLFYKSDLVVRYLEMELTELSHSHQVLDAAVDYIERQEKAAKMTAADNVSDSIMNELVDKSLSAKDALINKFTMLLNAKKARILALEKQLKRVSKGKTTDAVSVSVNDDANDGDSDKEGGPAAKRYRPTSDSDSTDYGSAIEEPEADNISDIPKHSPTSDVAQNKTESNGSDVDFQAATQPMTQAESDH